MKVGSLVHRRFQLSRAVLRLAALGLCFGVSDCGASQQVTPIPSFDSGSAVIADGVAIAQDGPADLTIGYIQRLPAIQYVWNSARPDVEGWPSEGQRVTWRAHLKNWRRSGVQGVDYAWLLDGSPVAGGRTNVPPLSEAIVDYEWTWTRERHVLELRVDSENRFTIPGGPRNRVRVFSDALAVGFYVERGFYEYFRRYQAELRIGNSSFEDWAQLQMEFWNLLLERAVFPESPRGVLDRVRLDNVTILADGALPLDPRAHQMGGFDARQARPNLRDLTVDLQWGFPTVLITQFGAFPDHSLLKTFNQFYYSGFVQHELGHARYLIDTYTFDVLHGVGENRVDISEGGQPIVGRYIGGQSIISDGQTGLRLHETQHKGMMNAQWTWLDRYSAVAMNRIAGRRATLGNYNAPLNIGAFVEDLPRRMRLTLMDGAGNTLDGASVRFYHGQPIEADHPARLYDDRPDAELATDREGRVEFGRDALPLELQRDGHANTTLILRVERQGKIGYGFLELSYYNLQYWNGRSEVGEQELRFILR